MIIKHTIICGSKEKYFGLLVSLVFLFVGIQRMNSTGVQRSAHAFMPDAPPARRVGGVFQHSPESLSSVPDWTAGGDQENSWFGVSVSTAGDVNGDGYSDVIVGAMGYDNGQMDEGKVFVYYGSMTGLSKTPSWTAEGDQEKALFGGSVATAGDVNGDGFSDIMIGARGYNDGQQAGGRVYVFYGSATGLPDAPDWMVTGDQNDDQFGISVSTAGDVNSDGYSDVVIGASWYDNEEMDAGRVFAFYGSADGLSDTPDWTAEGEQAYAFFGNSLSTAGDVNGDGFSDVVIGAYGFDHEQMMEGRAFVYYGSANGLLLAPNWTAEGNQKGASFGRAVSTAGDVNRDGYGDIIIGSSDNGEGYRGQAVVFYGSQTGLSAVPAWTAESSQNNSSFGEAVFTAGDVNADGFGDVVVGAARIDNGQEDEGQAFVYYGSGAGLSKEPGWTAEGDQAFSYFGGSVATAGDVNKDGSGDVIIGAWFYDDGQSEEGQAFVFHGPKMVVSQKAQTENNPWLTWIFIAGGLYFGAHTFANIGIMLQLLAALTAGRFKWPGPGAKVPYFDENSRLLSGHLFSSFVGYFLGLAGAFIFSVLMFLSTTPLMAGQIRFRWTWEFAVVIIVVYLGGAIGSRKIKVYRNQVKRLFVNLTR